MYVRPRCVLYSVWSGVQVGLSVFRMRLLAFVHVCISCRYGCMLCLAVFMFEWVDVMVMWYDVDFYRRLWC